LGIIATCREPGHAALAAGTATFRFVVSIDREVADPLNARAYSGSLSGFIGQNHLHHPMNEDSPDE
jgi:hypothetical protein